jgi:hypothetical protein
MAYLCSQKNTKSPNQLFYVWLFDLQTICSKFGLEPWASPNYVIRNYLLDMKHGWTKNMFWDVNNKKWRKRCKFVSPFLFNNIYGLPVLKMDTKCPNQVLYVCFVDLQDICVKYGLETWFSPNNDIRKWLLDMKHGWT